MEWEETHRRLLEGLRTEMRKKCGRIAEIEERLECSWILSKSLIRSLCHSLKVRIAVVT